MYVDGNAYNSMFYNGRTYTKKLYSFGRHFVHVSRLFKMEVVVVFTGPVKYHPEQSWKNFNVPLEFQVFLQPTEGTHSEQVENAEITQKNPVYCY